MKTANTRVARSSALPNRTRHRSDTDSVTATNAKRDFGKLLEAAIRGRVVVITKHAAPKAVLMSVEQFNGQSRPSEPNLDTLTRHYDALVARMQGPKARAAMQAAFDATPEELGRAAVAGARRRRVAR